MKLAVLLMSCTGSARVTDYDRAFVDRVLRHVADYFRDQSGGREMMTFQVFDWFELSLTSQQWDALGFGAGPAVKPMVAAGLSVNLDPFDHFALVIDKAGASLAAVSTTFPQYVHVAASDMDPSLLEHEFGHFFGAFHANLDSPGNTPIQYGDRFCIMGAENSKYSHTFVPLNRTLANGTINSTLSDTGPGMAAPALRAAGWLNLAAVGTDITNELKTGDRRATVTLNPLRGAPPDGSSGTVCAFADGVIDGQRLVLEYRSRDGWDQGMPPPAPGWVVAHFTGVDDRSQLSLQVGAVAATAGASMVTSSGGVRIGVSAASSSSVTMSIEALGPVAVNRGAPAVASWGKDRIDIFARGLDKAAFHKAWAQRWHPTPPAWEPLGGGFNSPFAVASWGPDRLDIFGIGLDQSAWHKAWAQAWHPSQTDWESLGGRFLHPLAVESWGPDRLDIFGIGTDQAMYHKAWSQAWHPSQVGWEPLGGKFISPPAVASWGPNRLDIFGIGLDKAMYHKAWANGWHPSPGWEFLGGGFSSPPTVCSWGPDRLDIFALGLDGAVWHKAWDQRWSPSPATWEPLGGKFLSAPAVASWGPGRLDVFGVGLDGAMYHKAWADGWHPWEFLGGTFSSAPSVVSWGPERLDIFAMGKDGGLWHKAWAQAWSPSVTDWEPLSGGFL